MVAFVIEAPATAPSGIAFSVNVHAVDYWGNVSPGTDVEGIVLVVNSSNAYWPNSHSGGGAVSIVDGVGTMTVTMPVGFGYVTLSLENPVGADAKTSSVLVVHIAESEDVFDADTLAQQAGGTKTAAANVRIALTVTSVGKSAGLVAVPAVAAATTTSCDNMPPTFLRDLTDMVWTFLGKDLIPLSDIRAGAFTCTQPATGTAAVVYRVAAAEGTALVLARRATDMLARRAAGTSALEDAAQSDDTLGLPNVAITGSVEAVAEETVGGLCTTSVWSPWDDCSVNVCSDRAGSQVKSRTCITEAATQACPATKCGDCAANNGGCSANAACSLDDAMQVVCTCDTTVFVGTGDACLDRVDAQRHVAGFEIQYSTSLSAVAATVHSQSDLVIALEATAAAALSVSPERLVASAVRPVTGSSFAFSLLVLPQTLSEEPDAAELAASMRTAAVFQSFQTSFQGMLLMPSATENFGQAYANLNVPAAEPNSPAGSDAAADAQGMTHGASGQATDASLGAAAAASTTLGWTTKDTVTLLAVLTALSVLLLTAFEAVYLKAAKSNALMQDASASATGGGSSDAPGKGLIGGGDSIGSMLFGMPMEEDGRGWTPTGFTPSGVDDFEPFPT